MSLIPHHLTSPSIARIILFGSLNASPFIDKMQTVDGIASGTTRDLLLSTTSLLLPLLIRVSRKARASFGWPPAPAALLAWHWTATLRKTTPYICLPYPLQRLRVILLHQKTTTNSATRGNGDPLQGIAIYRTILFRPWSLYPCPTVSRLCRWCPHRESR